MYNIDDKKTQSVAEAVKQVIEAKEDFKPHTMYDPKTGKEYEAKTLEDHLKMKDMGYTHEKPSEKNETEVQDSDKDAVDLHAVDKKKDPEKERQVEEKEVEDEDEVEEGNEFTAAAAKAKLAGKDKFEFEGKTYPVEIEKDAAEKILGKKEEVEITEDVDNFFGFKSKDKLVQFQSMAKKLKIKPSGNATIMKRMGTDYHVMPFSGKVKDIEKAISVAVEVEKGTAESVDMEEGFYADAMSPKEKKRLNSIYKEMDKVDVKIDAAIKKGDAKTVDKLGKEKQKLTLQVVNFFKEDAELEEASTDLEEAMKPADFVKGGDTKITKREVDGMLSKLFIDSKLAKAVEANSAFKNGEKSNGKKNPHKKDTADFHLFELGQQSASAE